MQDLEKEEAGWGTSLVTLLPCSGASENTVTNK